MAILSHEDFLTRVSNFFGETPDESNLSFMEDVLDTYNDTRSKSSGDDWKKKYEENDASWRKRYKERFFSPKPDSQVPGMEAYRTDKSDENVTTIEDTASASKVLSYDDLFE